MIVKNVEVPNPAQNSDFYFSLRRGLYGKGFGSRKNKEGAKLVAATKYWWSSYTVHIVNGPTLTIPAGYFYAYLYSYPNYRINTRTVLVEQGLSKGYFDDSIDEKLGGEKKTLGE